MRVPSKNIISHHLTLLTKNLLKTTFSPVLNTTAFYELTTRQTCKYFVMCVAQKRIALVNTMLFWITQVQVVVVEVQGKIN